MRLHWNIWNPLKQGNHKEYKYKPKSHSLSVYDMITWICDVKMMWLTIWHFNASVLPGMSLVINSQPITNREDN